MPAWPVLALAKAPERTHTAVMVISPLPRHGSTLPGRDQAGRRLRVAAHPELDRVVLSIWQDDVCRGTLRLAPQDVPELVRLLTESLVRPAGELDDVG